MTHEDNIEQAKKLLEEKGFTVTRHTKHDLDLLLILGTTCSSHFWPVKVTEERILGHAFDFKIMDDLLPQVYLGNPLPPKNKPWYQRFDKHVGKHRK